MKEVYRTSTVAVTASKTRGASFIWSNSPSSQLASTIIDPTKICGAFPISNVGACKRGQYGWTSSKYTWISLLVASDSLMKLLCNSVTWSSWDDLEEAGDCDASDCDASDDAVLSLGFTSRWDAHDQRSTRGATVAGKEEKVSSVGAEDNAPCTRSRSSGSIAHCARPPEFKSLGKDALGPVPGNGGSDQAPWTGWYHDCWRSLLGSTVLKSFISLISLVSIWPLPFIISFPSPVPSPVPLSMSGLMLVLLSQLRPSRLHSVELRVHDRQGTPSSHLSFRSWQEAHATHVRLEVESWEWCSTWRFRTSLHQARDLA